MESFVIQDWLTVRSAGSADFVQEANDWRGFSSYQDIVFWLDVQRANGPGGSALEWRFQTSPTKDEALFQTMTFVNSGAGIYVRPVILASSAVPLSTWVRWLIHPPTGAVLPWDTCFRVMAAANRVTRGLR